MASRHERLLGGVSALTSPLAWDADGVVVNSRAAAWCAVGDIVGLFQDRPTISSAEDRTRVFSRSAQAEIAGEDGAETLRELHRLLMRKRANTVAVFDGVLDIVARLERRPPLITAAYAEGIRGALGNKADLFSDIQGCERGPKETLLARAAQQGLRWFVTDTVADLRRCKANGVKTIAVTWGYDAAADLIAADADVTVCSPADLTQVLNELSFLPTTP